jgi:uncharacterized protein (DUF1501 family)
MENRGVSRRKVLGGAVATAGLYVLDRIAPYVSAVTTPVPAKKAEPVIKQKAKSVIQVFLWGGMSHTDTWDPKTDAGYDYTGEFNKAIPTNVDGIQIGALFPELAKQADKFSIIRSMTHRNFGHETAAYLMQTGHTPGERLAYPSVGAVFAYAKGDKYKGLIPPFVVMTQLAGRFSEAGFLPNKYKPFATGGDPNAARFEVEGVVARNISDNRQKERRKLKDKINTLGNTMVNNPEIVAANDAEKKAYELILGDGKEVFNLDNEKPELRDKFGRNTFGQECLVARRLVEAGVPYVNINYPAGWDTHKDHFRIMRAQCPQLDQGLATLFSDLSERGLLDSTIVWCTGEFGRTPKVAWEPPWNGGRHHYGNVFSVIVGGGGFKGGQIVGSSDAKGEEVKDRPVYPVDLLGSIYALAGIDSSGLLPHPLGIEAKVIPYGEEGVKSNGLLKEIM